MPVHWSTASCINSELENKETSRLTDLPECGILQPGPVHQAMSSINSGVVKKKKNKVTDYIIPEGGILDSLIDSFLYKILN